MPIEKIMSRDKLQKLPKLVDGGTVGIPNPGQFTFNPAAINPGSAQFQSLAKVTNTSGMINVLQNQDNFDLKQAQLDQQIIRDRQALAIANKKEKRAINKDIASRYKIDANTVSKNFGIDESTKSGRNLRAEMEKITSDIAAQQYEAILAADGNTQQATSDVARIKASAYERYNKIPGLQEHVDLNNKRIAIDGLPNAGNSTSRIAEAKLELSGLLNQDVISGDLDLSKFDDLGNFKDRSADIFSTLNDLTDGLFGSERKVANYDGERFLEHTLTKASPEEREKVVQQGIILLKGSEDALEEIQRRGLDPENEADLRKFVELEIAATEVEKKSGLSTGLVKLKDGDSGNTSEDYNAYSTSQLAEALGISNSNRGNKGEVIGLINKYKRDNPGITNEEIRDKYGADLLAAYNADNSAAGGGGGGKNQVTYKLPNGTELTREEAEGGVSAFTNNIDINDGISAIDIDGKPVLRIKKGTLGDFDDKNRASILAEFGILKPGQNIEDIKGGTSDDDYIYLPMEKIDGPSAGATTGTAGGGATAAGTAAGTAAVPPSTGILPPSFVAAIDSTESSTGQRAGLQEDSTPYDTLFGNSDLNGGPFEGTKVSELKVSEVIALQNKRGEGSYADYVTKNNPKSWSSGTVGEGEIKPDIGTRPSSMSYSAGVSSGKYSYPSTPAGKYQMVGVKLKELIKDGVIKEGDIFDAATQDRAAEHIAKKRIKSSTTPQGKRKALRDEWEGFANKTDAELDIIIKEFEDGKTGEIPTIEVPTDTTSVVGDYY